MHFPKQKFLMLGGALAPVAFMPGEGAYPDASALQVS